MEREVIKIEKKERETMHARSQKKQATKSMIHAKNVNTIQSQLRDHELCKKKFKINIVIIKQKTPFISIHPIASTRKNGNYFTIKIQILFKSNIL